MSGTLSLAGYHLTFDDEFNSFSSSPNGASDQWATTLWDIREMNDSSPTAGQEYFSDGSVGYNPFSLNNGVLTITARPGAASPQANSPGRTYGSGQINTKAMFSQEYGYFEMRAELPTGAGMWPAFWTQPANDYSPREIDAMEAFGAPNADGEGGTSLYHYDVHDSSNRAGTGAWVPAGTDLTTSYHSYGVLWTPTTLTYYFDGKQTAQMPTPPDIDTEPVYLIADLAVGGSWPGNANGETGQMKIDYIRAYSNDPNAPTKPLQPISSPDGGGHDFYGANVGATNAAAPTAQPAAAPTAPPTTSPDLTTVTSPSSAPIVDAQGNEWSLVQSASSGWQVAENGKIDPVTSYVDLLQFSGGQIVQENKWDNFYSENPASPGNWTQVAQPSSVTAPDHLALSLSEDAYQGDAQFIVSVDSKQIAGPTSVTALHSQNQSQEFDFGLNLGAGSHKVEVSFINDAYAGTPATDRNLYVDQINYNGAGSLSSTYPLMSNGGVSVTVQDIR